MTFSFISLSPYSGNYANLSNKYNRFLHKYSKNYQFRLNSLKYMQKKHPRIQKGNPGIRAAASAATTVAVPLRRQPDSMPFKPLII